MATHRAATGGADLRRGAALWRGVSATHEHEIILVDVSNPNWDEINLFKYYVWQNYGFDAARYSWDPEFNLYFMIAGPIFAALKAIGADTASGPEQKVIIAHEWLGMPVVFSRADDGAGAVAFGLLRA